LTAADFGRLASKYPEASTANLWGDRSTQRVCHLHGDVAELFRCMAVEVIERFSPSAVEWTGVFDTDGSASMANKVPANLGPAGFLLLNFCCCESCRQVGIRAGLDTNRIVRWMDERLTHALERGEPLVGRFEDWPDARPFLDWSAACREALRQVLESLRRASSCPMYVHVPGNARKTEESSFGGNDGSIWPGPRVWTHALSGSMEPAHPKADDHAQILAYDPLRPDGAWLVQALYSLAGAGFTSANLFHYGRVPVPHLAGIKQAIRFARRRDDAIRTPDASPGPAGV